MRTNKTKITVKYNKSDKKVIGYYPNNVFYPNEIFEDSLEIGYIEISNEEWLTRPKNAEVSNDLLSIQEIVKSENQLLLESIDKKIQELDKYHFNAVEIRQCKINNYFILQLSGEGRSLIQEQISLLLQKIKLNLITEEDASFEYFYNGGSIEISLVQLRQIYVAMLDIVNSNYQNYKAEIYLIKNLSTVEAVEGHDFTVNYLKNQNITL